MQPLFVLIKMCGQSLVYCIYNFRQVTVCNTFETRLEKFCLQGIDNVRG